MDIRSQYVLREIDSHGRLYNERRFTNYDKARDAFEKSTAFRSEIEYWPYGTQGSIHLVCARENDEQKEVL